MLLPGSIRQTGLPPEGTRLSEGQLRRALLLVVDGRRTRFPDPAAVAPGFQIVGTNSMGRSGPGLLGSASTYVSARTTASNPAELLTIPGGSDFTFQFVIDGISNAAGTNPGWFRNGQSSLGSTFLVTNGTSRRPWVRLNGTDVLKPTSGPQWVDGTTINLIVRVRSGVSVDVWWGGVKQHSATHSVAVPAITGSADGLWNLLINSSNENVGGSLVAFRAWARFLDDRETGVLSGDPWWLYAPRALFFPLPDGSALSAGVSEALTFIDAQAASFLGFGGSAESLTVADTTVGSVGGAAAQAESVTLADASAYPPGALTPLPRPARRLEQPVGRRVTAPWYARSGNRDWAYSGTVANATRQHNSTEGPHTAFLSSVCQSHIMADPIGADNTLNFTILARLRIDFASSTSVLFAFGNTADNLQHFLQFSTFDSALYFTVAGWNGTSNTSTTSDPTPALTTGRFYNIALTSRYQLMEIWLDGVKVVSKSHALTFAAHAMTHAVLHGNMSSGSPSASAMSISYVALLAFPGQVLASPELASITADPRGIHKLFEDRRQPLLLTSGGAVLNSAGAETLTLTASQTGAQSATSAEAEALTLTDAQAAALAAVGARTESLTLAESGSGLISAAGTASEGLTLADVSTGSGFGIVQGAESLTLTDGPASTIVQNKAVAESLTFADTLAVVLNAVSAVSESLTLTDAGAATTPGQAAVAESLTLTDAHAGAFVLRVAAAESVTLTEAMSALTSQLKAAAEAFTLTDGFTGNLTLAFTKSHAEALALAATGVGVLIAVSGGTTETVYVLAELTTMTVSLEEAEMVVPTDGNAVETPTLH